MSGPEFALSFDCPHCLKQWTTTASVRRDDDCPRCGVVSAPTRTRQISDWPWPTDRAPQRPYPALRKPGA